MTPWTLWFIHHRMTWILKALVYLSTPIHLIAYWNDAWDDVKYTIRNINNEVKK